MSHFAKLDENNVVVFVTVGRQEDDGKEAELSARTGERYVQTSYNTHGNVHLLGGTPFRGNFAGIGYTYDEANDVFYAPQPFPSWTLDDQWNWQAPVPYPDDGGMYNWDEDSLAWVEVD
jgi:hypothetical protein